MFGIVKSLKYAKSYDKMKFLDSPDTMFLKDKSFVKKCFLTFNIRFEKILDNMTFDEQAFLYT